MPRKRDDDEGERERPMTEAEWEREFRESDARADRFGELLETLMDHPDRDEIIAREMGWEGFAEALKEQKEGASEQDEDEDEDEDEEWEQEREQYQEQEQELEQEPDLTPAEEAEDEDDDPFQERALKEIPAYQIADSVAEMVRLALEPYKNRPEDEEDEEDNGELIGKAFMGIHTAVVKMSGGHAMGYHDDVLCGNIVKNKQALEGARQSMRAFQELGERKIIPARVIDPIMPKLLEAESAIEARIEELRAMVWWDK
jgi:hypothetical protein